MKINIYDIFPTNKIKVYPTTKKMQPFVLRRDKVHMVLPLLLASAMVFVACGDDRRNKRKEEPVKVEKYSKELTDIYKKAIQVYHLDRLEYKEPLPQEMIEQLLADPQAPTLEDVNYNHMPADMNNFWEIIKNGIVETQKVQKSKKLSEAQKKKYKITAYKMLSQISRYKGTATIVDLHDYNNLKAFLYFEKVIHYKDKADYVLEESAGWNDERKEILGRYYKQYEILDKKVEANPSVKNFAKALYLNDDRFMLSYADSMKANKLSMILLNQWLEKMEVRDSLLWNITEVQNFEGFCNSLVSWRNRGDRYGALLYVDGKGDTGDGGYCPVGVILIHELLHATQKKPASAETPEDNKKQDHEVLVVTDEGVNFSLELGPTLTTLMQEDQIYKKLNNIDSDKILHYGKLDFGSHQVELGEIAVWFKKMSEKYPHQSPDEVLAEKEVFTQLEKWGKSSVLTIPFHAKDITE